MDRPGSPPPRAPRQAPRQAPQRPAPPRPDPAELREVNRRVGTFVLLVVAAVLTSGLPVPWQLGSLAFAVAAVVTGVWALRAASRPSLRQQVAPPVVVGLVFTAFMTMSIGASLILWDAQLERQDCLANALTLRAQEQCEARYEQAVEERLAELTRRP